MLPRRLNWTLDHPPECRPINKPAKGRLAALRDNFLGSGKCSHKGHQSECVRAVGSQVSSLHHSPGSGRPAGVKVLWVLGGSPRGFRKRSRSEATWGAAPRHGSEHGVSKGAAESSPKAEYLQPSLASGHAQLSTCQARPLLCVKLAAGFLSPREEAADMQGFLHPPSNPPHLAPPGHTGWP